MNDVPLNVKKEKFRRGLKSFILRRVTKIISFHVARVIKYEEDLVIRLLDINDNIEIAWSDNLLRILKHQELEVGDDVAVAYFIGKFYLLDKVINNLDEISVGGYKREQIFNSGVNFGTSGNTWIELADTGREKWEEWDELEVVYVLPSSKIRFSNKFSIAELLTFGSVSGQFGSGNDAFNISTLSSSGTAFLALHTSGNLCMANSFPRSTATIRIYRVTY